MQELYQAEGILNSGFVGQITYTVCLERPYEKLDIGFTFNQQRFEPADATDSMLAQMKQVFQEKYQVEMSDEEIRRCVLETMKTEIHTLVTLNDEFIGCIHRQMTERHMRYDGDYATEGCIPQSRFEGVLKVTVLVFNVIKDRTHYTLRVCAE